MTALDPRIELLSGRDVDYEAYADLQQAVFGDVLRENDIALERLSPEVFAWKFNPPAGESIAAVVRDQGQLVAGCFLAPVALRSGSRSCLGYQACDGATRERARGQGFFGGIMTALSRAVAAEDMLFAFPNPNSWRTFERSGFRRVTDVPLWVRPRPRLGSPALDPNIRAVDRFGEEQDALAARLVTPGVSATFRDAAYLNFRYVEHPYFDYQCFQYWNRDEIEGVMVLNRMHARGRTSLWVMELAGTNNAVRSKLARHARALAKQQDCDVVLSMSNRRMPGALRLPGIFLPKRHALVVRAGGDNPEAHPNTQPETEPQDWFVSTGDWDTF